MCFDYDSPLCNSLTSNQVFQCPTTPQKNQLVQSSRINNDPEFIPISSSILGPSPYENDSSFHYRMAEESFLESTNRLPVSVLVLKPQNIACSREAHVRKLNLSSSDIMDDFPALPFSVFKPAPPTMGVSDSVPVKSVSVPEQVSASRRNTNLPVTTQDVPGPTQPLLGRSHSNPEQFLARAMNTIVPSVTSIFCRRPQPSFGRSSSDPEQFSAFTKSRMVHESFDPVSRDSRISDQEKYSASPNAVSSNKERTLPIRRNTLCNLPVAGRFGLNAKSA